MIIVNYVDVNNIEAILSKSNGHKDFLICKGIDKAIPTYLSKQLTRNYFIVEVEGYYCGNDFMFLPRDFNGRSFELSKDMNEVDVIITDCDSFHQIARKACKLNASFETDEDLLAHFENTTNQLKTALSLKNKKNVIKISDEIQQYTTTTNIDESARISE